jgi:hypothetical protein
VAPTVAPEILPVLVVEPPDRPENEYLRGDTLWAHLAFQGIVALQYSQVAFLNASVNRLAIIESVITNQSSYVRRGAPFVGMPPIALPNSRDGRTEPQPSEVDLVAGTSLVQIVPSIILAPNVRLEVPWIIPPGDTLVVQVIALAADCLVQFIWRERYFEAGEL